MKLQTSIEFVAILSAVVAFAVFALGVYMHVASAQNHAFNSIAQLGSSNVVFSGNGIGESEARITLSLPSFSYVNKTNMAYIIVSLPPGTRIESLEINGTPNVAASPNIFRNISYGLSILNASYLPTALGVLTMHLSAIVSNSSGINTISENASTTVVYLNQSATGNQSTSLQAAINTFNESAVYNMSNPQNVSRYVTWQHCPYHNWFWGYILPENRQCGSGTWGFIINGNCDQQRGVGWDMYVCVRANSTGETVSTVSARYERNYSIGVSIYNATLKLHSNLSQSDNSSLLLSKKDIDFGNIIVSSVSGDGYLPEPYSTTVMLTNGSTRYLVNESAYSSYASIATTLLQDLHAYNGTWLQQNSYTLIMSLLNGTNQAQDALASAKAVNNIGCSINQNPLAYICNPFSQYSYGIEVLPSNSFKVQNQSIDVGTSVINIK